MYATAFLFLAIAQTATDDRGWPPNRMPPRQRETKDDTLILSANGTLSEEQEFFLGRLSASDALKEGPLRPEEWELLHSPTIGLADIVAWLEPGHVDSRSLPTSSRWADCQWTTEKGSRIESPSEDVRLARTTVRVEQAGVWMGKLEGAGIFFVNGEPYLGDVQRRGFEGVPIALRAGSNEVVVARIDGAFDFELWKAPSRVVVAWWDVWQPRRRAWAGLVGREGQSFPVFNASLEPVDGLHVHYGSAVPAGNPLGHASAWACGDPLPPLGMCMSSILGISLGASDELVATDVDIGVIVFGGIQEEAERRVLHFDPTPERIADRPAQDLPWAELRARVQQETCRSFVLVVGTRGDPAQDAALASLARYWQQHLWYEADITPLVIRDTVFDATGVDRPSVPKQGPLVLIGDRSSNSLIAALPGSLGDTLDRDGLTIVPDLSKLDAAAPNHALVCVHSAEQARLALAMDPFFDESLSGPVATLKWPTAQNRK